MSDKMKLWEAVSKTDPAMTKKVNSRGGFTAIGAQYQVKMATEQFGPYGQGWGVKNLDWEYIPSVEDVKEVALNAVFFYPDGEFEISACMMYKAGNETRKKLLTDLTTKALSKLGFNADVFMGMFDDNKYIQERTQEVRQEKEEKAGTTTNFKFLNAMKAQKERIGDTAYYEKLNNAGYEKANEIVKRDEQTRMYELLVGVPDASE